MLVNAKSLTGYKLQSLDGEIGKVREFYFDDRFWAVRYLVADTGGWLTGRQVLISPYALISANTEEQHLTVDLTKKQIEDSPSLSSDKPVSLQFEESHFGYYGLSAYWNDLNRMGPAPDLMAGDRNPDGLPQDKADWDPNLRSTSAVIGHHVQASDDEIGHIEDFIIDDQTWAIRYLVVNTRNWLPGKKILVSLQWVERVSWTEAKVYVNLPSEMIRTAPEYDDDSPITREFEESLHQHFLHEGYWVEQPDQ